MSPQTARTATLFLFVIAAACGGEAAPERPVRRLATAAPSAEPLPIVVSADVALGACFPESGAILNREGLTGWRLLLDPRREIVALVEPDGGLAFYRDMLVGPGGYTVRLDVQSDSGSVLDRTTRTVTRGSVADFRSRPELGPPDSIVDHVLAHCAPND